MLSHPGRGGSRADGCQPAGLPCGLLCPPPLRRSAWAPHRWCEELLLGVYCRTFWDFVALFFFFFFNKGHFSSCGALLVSPTPTARRGGGNACRSHPGRCLEHPLLAKKWWQMGHMPLPQLHRWRGAAQGSHESGSGSPGTAVPTRSLMPTAQWLQDTEPCPHPPAPYLQPARHSPMPKGVCPVGMLRGQHCPFPLQRHWPLQVCGHRAWAWQPGA